MTSVSGAETPPRGSVGRRLSTFFYRHPRVRLAALLALPVGWMVVVYLGSLVVLLLSAFWDTDPFTAEVVREFTLDNFRDLFERDVYRDVAWRTIRMAALVTVADAVLAFPITYSGTGRVAADAKHLDRRSAHAALGELPRQGDRLADRPFERRRRELGPRAFRRPGRRAVDRGSLARLHLSVAPVHDPADLRGSRTDPELAPRGVCRSRRACVDDVPSGHPAARVPCRRRRVDLHVLADARRLHRAEPDHERAVHRHRHLPETWREPRSRPRSRSSRSWR